MGNEPSTVDAHVANPAHSCPHVQKVPVPLPAAGGGVFQITTNVLGRVTFPVSLQAVNASPGSPMSSSQGNKERNSPSECHSASFSSFNSIWCVAILFCVEMCLTID